MLFTGNLSERLIFVKKKGCTGSREIHLFGFRRKCKVFLSVGSLYSKASSHRRTEYEETATDNAGEGLTVI